MRRILDRRGHGITPVKDVLAMWCSISYLNKLIDCSCQWVIPRKTRKISSNNEMVFYRNSKHSRLNLTHSRSQDAKRKICLHCGTTSSAVLYQFYLIWPSPFKMLIEISIFHEFVVQYICFFLSVVSVINVG